MASRNIADAHQTIQDQYKKAKADFERENPTVKVVITCSYRSNAEQDALYAQGRTKPGQKVTNAKAGQSPHNYLPSYAIDVAFDINGKTDWSDKWFTLFSKKMQHPQIEWGGNWKSIKDLPHFEIKGWATKTNK